MVLRLACTRDVAAEARKVSQTGSWVSWTLISSLPLLSSAIPFSLHILCSMFCFLYSSLVISALLFSATLGTPHFLIPTPFPCKSLFPLPYYFLLLPFLYSTLFFIIPHLIYYTSYFFLLSLAQLCITLPCFYSFLLTSPLYSCLLLVFFLLTLPLF